MKISLGGISAAFSIALFIPAFAGSAHASDVATRCNSYGCDRIYCNATGDRCHRLSNDGDRFYASGYRRYDDDDYYGGYHLVCDSDGDRCYRSAEPYWNYRQYYRLHGYRWSHYRWSSGYRESDRLNDDELYRHRYDGGYRDWDDYER